MQLGNWGYSSDRANQTIGGMLHFAMEEPGRFRRSREGRGENTREMGKGSGLLGKSPKPKARLGGKNHTETSFPQGPGITPSINITGNVGLQQNRLLGYRLS